MQCNLSNIRFQTNKKADPGTPAVRIDRRYTIDGGLTYLLPEPSLGGGTPFTYLLLRTVNRRWGAEPPP